MNKERGVKMQRGYIKHNITIGERMEILRLLIQVHQDERIDGVVELEQELQELEKREPDESRFVIASYEQCPYCGAKVAAFRNIRVAVCGVCDKEFGVLTTFEEF